MSFVSDKQRKKVMGYVLGEQVKLDSYRSTGSLISEDDILEEFKKQAKEVWGDSSIIDRLKIKVVVDKEKMNLAGVHYSRYAHPVAIDDRLLQAPSEVELHVNPGFLNLESGEQKRILAHEAIHLGYPRHDKGFREIATKKGVLLTVQHMRTGKVLLEKKIGKRYVKIREFEDVETARSEAKEMMRLEPKARFRVHF